MRERVHAVRDRWADFDAGQVDAAPTFLLQSLCDPTRAGNTDWIGVVRMDNVSRCAAADGWRPPVARFLHSTGRLGIFRDYGQSFFSEEERDLLAFALRGIK